MRLKCLCRPFVHPTSLKHVWRAYFSSRGVADIQKPGQYEIHLETPASSIDRDILLKNLKWQLQVASPGPTRKLPRNFLDLLPSKFSHTLLPVDPATRWVSFLLRKRRASLAMQAFSTYINHGAKFSLPSMVLLCQDAASSPSTNPSRLLAKHVSLMAIKLKEDAFPAVDELITMFSRYNKNEAVLEMGILLLQGGRVLNAKSFRHILRAIFRVHSKHRINHPSGRTVNARSLISLLADWLAARQKCDQRLDQFDIAILIQGLSYLLSKKHHREHLLPASTEAAIASLLKLLSGHIKGAIARFAAAESMLDNHSTTHPHNRHPNNDNSVFVYNDIIAWAARWKDSPRHNPSRVTTNTAGALVKRSRLLMILARDRLYHEDVVGAAELVNEIWQIQNAISTSLSRRLRLHNSASNPQEVALLKRYIKDARLRFVSALIRACSHFLKSQNAEGVLLVIHLTKHLEDMDTFVRLWKRAFFLFVSLGTWQGSLGLRSLLFLFMDSIPQGWTTETLGEIIFTSPGLLSGIVRVANGSSNETHGEACTASSPGAYLGRFGHEGSQLSRELEAILSPSSSSAPALWRRILAIRQTQPKTLSDSLLDRMTSSRK